MLPRQESQPEQNVSQDPHQAALDALHKRERELVANLQHGSPILADNTRNAYRVILLDYKVFSYLLSLFLFSFLVITTC